MDWRGGKYEERQLEEGSYHAIVNDVWRMIWSLEIQNLGIGRNVDPEREESSREERVNYQLLFEKYGEGRVTDGGIRKQVMTWQRWFL